MKEKYTLDNSNYGHRQRKWLPKIIMAACVVIFGLAVIFLSIYFVNRYNKNRITVNTIKTAWQDYDYEKVYELSKAFLQENPYNNSALTYYSYACFFLALSQTDTQLSQTYLDECINNIRIALYESSKSLTPQLQYMLGRAYFYKNTITTYYYADLAVKYLGLSYAALGMTMESISAFTEALLVRESDALLLSIAEQYYNINEYGAAEQYLFRIIKNSENDDIIIKSEILLGTIYIAKENYEAAMQEFENVLKKNENSADAHYGIGVIYEKQSNIVKARAEWRQALKIQVNHAGALQKLSEN